MPPHICWVTEAGETGVAGQTAVITAALADRDYPIDVVQCEPLDIAHDSPVIRDADGLCHPARNLSEALLHLGPDIVVFHASGPTPRQAARTVQPFAITVGRIGINIREHILAGSGYIEQLPSILEYLHGLDHVIASSPRTGRELQAYGIDADRITEIPTAIRASDATVREPQTPPPDRVGCIGRIGKIKNQLVIVEALSALRQLDSDCRPALSLAGSQNDSMLSVLDGFASNLVPNFGIEAHGYVESPLTEFYSHLGVHCHPSWTEHCPQTLLEAAVCGVPSIVSDLAWADAYPEVEWVRCPPDDPWAWAEAIHDLLTDLEQYRAVATAQQEAVLDHYTADAIVPEYEVLFGRLADSMATFKIDAEAVV